jgi:eukaryotic-like serine/threonine-protein kinase
VEEITRAQGRPAIVIEHVDGAALNRVRGMMRTVGFGLDDTAALHIAAGVFGALAEAHAKGIVHRYVSPSKVLIGWDGAIKVRDFGLPEPAKLNAAAVAVARGADRYMAPEQVNGKEVTARTDVYDAALVLWELLSKKRAFRNAKRAIDTWRSMAEPRLETLDTLRPDLDVRVRDVVRKALAVSPEDRDVTAKQIALVLREIVPEGEGCAHLSALMEMVRHEPSPLPSELPPPGIDQPPPVPPRMSRPSPNARGSLPTLDLSPPMNAPRVAKHVSASAAVASVASVEPSTPEGAVTAVMTALDLASKRLASGTMPAVKAGPDRTSSVKMRAVSPAGGPRRTSSAKMPAVKPPPLPPRVAKPPPVPSAIPPLPIVAAAPPPPPVDDGADRPSFISPAKVLVIDIADKAAPDGNEAVTAVPPPMGGPTEESMVALPLTRKIEPTVVVAEEPAAAEAAEAWFQAEQPPSEPAIETAPEEPDLSRSRPTEISIERATRKERRRSGTATVLMLGLIAVVGTVGADALGLVHLPVSVSARQAIMKRARTWLDVTESNEAPLPTAPAPAVAPPPPEPAGTASASAQPDPAIPADMGLLKTTGLAPNRRIFVDERTVGQTPASVLVKCGAHTVMIGSAGRRQSVDIPCGGELNAGER